MVPTLTIPTERITNFTNFVPCWRMSVHSSRHTCPRLIRKRSVFLLPCSMRHANAILHYAVWWSLNIIPPFEDIEEARVNLMGLSGAVGVEGQREDNRRRQEHIETALRLKT